MFNKINSTPLFNFRTKKEQLNKKEQLKSSNTIKHVLGSNICEVN